ncbi:HD-GYP domain-containing protein [Psychromonas ossibalaenae]|uniref:HD-GYP domain-containing protein n=1 Tax=Psychromonas ossibalaenae TaxID=444922 RepID=UPI0003602E94|nr:HD domain-containing phosphohydrolase [Psychromonas ossibalaenae]
MDMIRNNKAQEIDVSSYLEHHSDLQGKIHEIRKDLSKSFPFINRVAIALYDVERDVIKTHAFDEDRPSDLHNYEAILSECSSLQHLASCAQERVVNDISIFDHSSHTHTALVRQAGYLSSLTIPLLLEGQLLGFLFVNSRTKNVFTEEVVQRLRLLSMVITLLLHRDTARINVLKSTIESMKIISSHRDPETGEHLQRMASYSLLIAREIADIYELSDLFISYIYLYAPMHDLGKLAVPDHILLKNGSLTDKEFSVMQGHTASGDDLIKKLIEVYKLSDLPFISSLITIVRSHHEKIDGTGYPDHLTAHQIEIEARIVAVADIFDALTSERPYKKAWTIDDAFAELKRLSGIKLDSDCVNALLNNRSKVLKIMDSFKDACD